MNPSKRVHAPGVKSIQFSPLPPPEGLPAPTRLPPFRTASLKVERAQKHISELCDLITRLFSEKPVVIIIEDDPELKEHGIITWRARIRKSVPLELPGVIGDAVHNLRTALDLLATDLVRLKGENTNGVYFPFAKSAAELEKQIRKKNMHRAGPEVVKVLRSLKPYIGGNIPLRALHDLDIDDKHKALIPVVHAASLPSFSLFSDTARNIIPPWDTNVTHDGQIIFMMPTIENLDVGNEMPATFRMVFGHNSTLAGSEIVPTLKNLAQLVADTINKFAALYVGVDWPPEAIDTSSQGRKTLLIGPHDSFSDAE